MSASQRDSIHVVQAQVIYASSNSNYSNMEIRISVCVHCNNFRQPIESWYADNDPMHYCTLNAHTWTAEQQYHNNVSSELLWKQGTPIPGLLQWTNLITLYLTLGTNTDNALITIDNYMRPTRATHLRGNSLTSLLAFPQEHWCHSWLHYTLFPCPSSSALQQCPHTLSLSRRWDLGDLTSMLEGCVAWEQTGQRWVHQS